MQINDTTYIIISATQSDPLRFMFGEKRKISKTTINAIVMGMTNVVRPAKSFPVRT